MARRATVTRSRMFNLFFTDNRHFLLQAFVSNSVGVKSGKDAFPFLFEKKRIRSLNFGQDRRRFGYTQINLVYLSPCTMLPSAKIGYASG